jgi:hypothetical protein
MAFLHDNTGNPDNWQTATDGSLRHGSPLGASGAGLFVFVVFVVVNNISVVG